MFPSRRITIGGGDKFEDKYSLHFDGSEDFIQLDTALDLSWEDTPYSFVFWVKRDAVGSWDGIFGRTIDPDGPSDSTLTYGQESHMIFNPDGTSIIIEGETPSDSITFTCSPTATAGTWYHFVCATDGSGNASVYQNGVKLSDNGNTLSSNFKINSIAKPHGFNGRLNDVSIYNTELTQAQAIALYNGREPYNHREGQVAKNLMHWWRMGDTTQRKAYNTSEQITDTNNKTFAGSGNWSALGNATINLNDTVTGKMHITTGGSGSADGIELNQDYVDGSGGAYPIVPGRAYRVSAKLERLSGNASASFQFFLGGVGGIVIESDLSSDGSTYNGSYPSDGTITADEETYFADIVPLGTDGLRIAADDGSTAVVFTVDDFSVRELGIIRDDSTNTNNGYMVNMSQAGFVGDVPW
tara:strand:- start:461 stop:1696 length:1236 start_codon:yes stop_codon:yes gene_type:complete